jgi:hypothetical protein
MQKRTKALIAAAFSASLMSSGLFAADEAKAKWYDNISASGFMQGGYEFDLNGLTSTTPLKNRAFDSKGNNFDGGAGITLNTKVPAGDMGDLAGTLEFIYGPQYAGITTNLPIEQGFVSMTHNGWTMKGGIFDTFLGTEVIDAPGNWNWSRSLLFQQIPFIHNGMELSGNIGGLGVMAMIANSNPAAVTAYNGTNIAKVGIGTTNTYSANDSKDLGAQLTYSLMGWNWTFNYLQNQYASGFAGIPYANGNTFNVLTNYTIMEGLNFAAEYLYQGETWSATIGGATVSGSGKQQGYAAYLSYDIPQVSGLSIAPRFEQWWTPDVVSSPVIASETDEFTISLKYKMGAVTHFLEYRHDFGNAAQYVYGNGAAGFNQDTLQLGGQFSF